MKQFRLKFYLHSFNKARHYEIKLSDVSQNKTLKLKISENTAPDLYFFKYFSKVLSKILPALKTLRSSKCLPTIISPTGNSL